MSVFKQTDVVLLSGGLDSAANLALSKVEGRAVLALTAHYGQRAFERELQSAKRLAEWAGVEHAVVDLQWLGRLGGSALTDSTRDVPQVAREALDDRVVTEESARKVWVPNRNGVLIQVAAAFAEARGLRRVLVGFNREEAATFPDNTAAFITASNSALEYSTARESNVKVASYTVAMDKREIVARLKQEENFPFEALWSCYHSDEVPCGVCESCERLKRALDANEVQWPWPFNNRSI